jgi:SET domain-containing protein
MSGSKKDRPFRVARSRTGLGLFATAAIKRGAFIIRYAGRRVSNDRADEIDNRYLFELNSFWSIDGASRSNVARYINHSCRPNAEVYFVGHVVKIRARRNIEAGEEIAYDYGRDHFDAFIRPKGCRCDKCRRRQNRRRK